MKPILKFVLETAPIFVFFIGNSKFGIFTATIAFMVATSASLIISYAINRTIPTMPLVTGVFVLIMGGLTIWLQDETFIKIKPTIVNCLFAAILIFGLLRKQFFLKFIFEQAFVLTHTGWLLLTRLWIIFFFLLAGLNEIVWRLFPTDTWVTFKVFGVMPLTILFVLCLIPLIQKHSIDDPKRHNRPLP
jgi:intracellular septation protein